MFIKGNKYFLKFSRENGKTFCLQIRENWKRIVERWIELSLSYCEVRSFDIGKIFYFLFYLLTWHTFFDVKKY